MYRLKETEEHFRGNEFMKWWASKIVWDKLGLNQKKKIIFKSLKIYIQLPLESNETQAKHSLIHTRV